MRVLRCYDRCHSNRLRTSPSRSQFAPHLKILQVVLLFCTFSTCYLKPVHSVDVNTPSTSSVQFLQKCPGSEISVDTLAIPPGISFQLPGKTRFYQAKFNTTNLFNFTFIPVQIPKNSGQSGKSGKTGILSGSRSCLTRAESYFSVELPWARPANAHQVYRGFFDPRGVLILKHKEKDIEIYFHPKNYCLNRLTDYGFEAHFCKTPCANDFLLQGDETPCYPKCCSIGQKFYQNAAEINRCITTDDADLNFPDIYSESGKKLEPEIFPNFMINARDEHLILWNCSKPVEIPNSDSPISFLPIQKKNLRLTKSGSIYNWRKYWHESKYEVLYESDHMNENADRNFSDSSLELRFSLRPPICFEEVIRENVSAKVFNESDVLVQSCWANFNSLEKKRQIDEAASDYYYYQRIVTYPKIKFWIFLAATLIHLCTLSVYLVLWSKQNVHGWTVFTFTVCNFLLSLGYSVQEGMQGYYLTDKDLGRFLGDLYPLCLILGIGLHFLSLASFSWTAILSFDAWAKLRSMTAMSRNYKGGKRFLAYCAAGFSLPFLWTLMAVLIEFNANCEEELCPGYSTKCQVFGSANYYTYVLAPILTLFLLSMIFASMTVHFILSAKKNMTNLKDSRSTNKSNNNAKLAIKLFLMMGLLLIFEVIQSIYNLVWISMWWIILDFYRLFHALAIFWIFVGNARMMKTLGEKFTIIRRIVEPTTETTTSGPSVGGASTPKTRIRGDCALPPEITPTPDHSQSLG